MAGMEMRESMYNILICDDEKDIVNALKIYLNDTNYHFLEAFDGEEAVHVVETKEVHLVLMDIMMPVALTPTEYDILKLLMQNPGQVFSPREIYLKIWNDLPLGSENTVAVHIRHLREKLEINPAEPRYLKVVWGQGYKCEKQG